jgi:hypothetical protein
MQSHLPRDRGCTRSERKGIRIFGTSWAMENDGARGRCTDGMARVTFIAERLLYVCSGRVPPSRVVFARIECKGCRCGRVSQSGFRQSSEQDLDFLLRGTMRFADPRQAPAGNSRSMHDGSRVVSASSRLYAHPL